MLVTVSELIQRLRGKRWANLLAVNVRILIGFAFIPAGLQKVLGQPFTDPGNTGLFHDFLHAFHATGGFYRFVGIVQLTAAVLLMTQRFATLGALMTLPVLSAIVVFCWSTSAGVPTMTVTALMLLATLALLLWDEKRLRVLVSPSPFDEANGGHAHAVAMEAPAAVPTPVPAPVIDMQLWQRCGLAILVLYFAVSAWSGGVYRPRGVELDNPAFYLLPAIAVLPIITLVVDQRRYRLRKRTSG